MVVAPVGAVVQDYLPSVGKNSQGLVVLLFFCFLPHAAFKCCTSVLNLPVKVTPTLV